PKPGSSRRKAVGSLSTTATEWPRWSRMPARPDPTRPQPTMTTCIGAHAIARSTGGVPRATRAVDRPADVRQSYLRMAGTVLGRLAGVAPRGAVGGDA